MLQNKHLYSETWLFTSSKNVYYGLPLWGVDDSSGIFGVNGRLVFIGKTWTPLPPIYRRVLHTINLFKIKFVCLG